MQAVLLWCVKMEETAAPVLIHGRAPVLHISTVCVIPGGPKKLHHFVIAITLSTLSQFP